MNTSNTIINNELFKISGDMVYLRKFTFDDVIKVFEMSIEEGMKKWIPDQVYANCDETEEVLTYLINQYESGKNPSEVPIVFGICLSKTGHLIGHAGLSPVNGSVEIGYAIEQAMQGNGYASQAVSVFCKWALNYYNIPCIFGIVASENVASVKVLEKAGFIFSEEKEKEMHGKLKQVKVFIVNK